MGDFEVKTRKNGFHLFFDKISYGIFCSATKYAIEEAVSATPLFVFTSGDAIN